jgi:uncharacterized protein YjbI with pentapeptide repeats
MANDDHIAQLMKGVPAWNAWRGENPNLRPDLTKASFFTLGLDSVDSARIDLRGVDLSGADLRWVDFRGADLRWGRLAKARLVGSKLGGADLSEASLVDADLYGADLSGANLAGAKLFDAHIWKASLHQANLSKADLSGADVYKADFSGADLREAVFFRAKIIETNFDQACLVGAKLSEVIGYDASFRGADLSGAKLWGATLPGADLRGTNLRQAELLEARLPGANLTGANLSGANLRGANLVNCNLTDADLTGSRVFGISAWNLKVDGVKQQNLIVTDHYESDVSVDNIEVAQFVYLLLHNEKIRDVIDTVTSKTVLILGRFTDERKAVLDALREALRKRDYVPILFDFEKPRGRDTDETITLLARMARFVIADISDAKAVLQELRAIVPDLPSVPVQPIILATQEEPGMFDFYRSRPSFLTVHRYADQEQLLADLGDKVIRPAELKVLELRG